MSKKTVMGHNPLGSHPLADAEFKFIPQTEAGSAKVNKPEKKAKTSKKTVSYYLEESVIDEIKRIAKVKEDSNSHLVNQILKKAIDK